MDFKPISDETQPVIEGIREGENSDKVVLSERLSGMREEVRRIRIPDYGVIEGWPAGDLELQLTAATAAAKVFDGQLPEINKDDIDDVQWYSLRRILFHWYRPIHGDLLNVHWVEVDAGGSPGSQTLTVPPQSGFPGVTYTFATGSNDEDMGEQIVQFDDDTAYMYSSGLIDWYMDSIIAP